MQDYIGLAAKNGVILLDKGRCQFCSANTNRGIHECLEIFNLGFKYLDYSNEENHIFRFLSVDAHTLQHPEIHGRWNNHFHLSRLHLIFKYDINWIYRFSPRLSECLNRYKVDKQSEYLQSPEKLKRGKITTTYIRENATNVEECKRLIKDWAQEVYLKWSTYHNIVDPIANEFLKF